MNITVQIPKLQARVDWWESNKHKWLIKHGSTFANVDTDKLKEAVAFRSDPEKVKAYYERKPDIFKSGYTVACISGGWLEDKKFLFFRWKVKYQFGPKYKDIMIVSGTTPCGTYLSFKEFPNHCYESKHFRKVDETFATETLAEIAEQIESEQLIIN